MLKLIFREILDKVEALTKFSAPGTVPLGRNRPRCPFDAGVEMESMMSVRVEGRSSCFESESRRKPVPYGAGNASFPDLLSLIIHRHDLPNTPFYVPGGFAQYMLLFDFPQTVL